MTAIAFDRRASRLTILNPFNGFAREEHTVEVRKDPLLGDTSVYNPYLKDKAKAFFGQNDDDLIGRLARESADNCIFCPGNVATKTAMYPEEMIVSGRIRKGGAVLFSNLYSLGAYHPVIALSSAHFLRPSEFTREALSEGFLAAHEFLRAVYDRDVSAVHAAICSNYLLPAGASLVHPHMQMLITPIAYSYHARLQEGCRRYHAATGSAYHDDLVAEEQRRGERYVARLGNWHWIAAFSPLGSNEICAMHADCADIGESSGQDLVDLADGITRVLRLYEQLGHISFNYALYSVRSGGISAGQRCIFKIVSRQNLYPNYRNDDYFLQKMLQCELMFTLPEELAGMLRALFS